MGGSTPTPNPPTPLPAAATRPAQSAGRALARYYGPRRRLLTTPGVPGRCESLLAARVRRKSGPGLGGCPVLRPFSQSP